MACASFGINAADDGYGKCDVKFKNKGGGIMDKTSQRRRQLLAGVVTSFSFVGVGFLGVPFIRSWWPRKERIHDFDVIVDISKLDIDNPIKVTFKGLPILIFKRSQEELDTIKRINIVNLRDPESKLDDIPYIADKELRAIRPDIMVVTLVCQHLGCEVKHSPKGTDGFWPTWQGGFYCPCHGSTYDLAGRVFLNESTKNLPIPPYKFIDDKTIVLGRV